MDYWCCGVWPSIGCGVVARALVCPCRDFSRSANSIIEFQVKTRNLSNQDSKVLFTSRGCVITKNWRCADCMLAAAHSCRDKPGSNDVAGFSSPTTSKRRLANLVFIAHCARRTARPPWSSANTYVSANKDGWQQLYNSFTCLSLGCITQNPRYLSSAEQVPNHCIPTTIAHTSLFASTYSFLQTLNRGNCISTVFAPPTITLPHIRDALRHTVARRASVGRHLHRSLARPNMVKLQPHPTQRLSTRFCSRPHRQH
jgi:hypothetical protein